MFRKSSSLCFAGILGLLASPAWATTAVLLQDTYVNSASNLAFGALGNLNVGLDATNAQSVAILQFGLGASVPSPYQDKDIAKATLYLFVNRTGGTVPNIGVYAVDSKTSVSWSESTLSYGQAASSNLLSTSTGVSQIGTIQSAGIIASSWVTVDITSQVRAWVRDNKSKILILSDSNAAIGTVFLDSKESTGTSHAPMLDITLNPTTTPVTGNLSWGENALSQQLNVAPAAIPMQNIALGAGALHSATGQGNIAVGNAAGSALSQGDNNIYIGNVGVDGESGTIRIGATGTQTTYLAGAAYVLPGLPAGGCVSVDSSGKLSANQCPPGPIGATGPTGATGLRGPTGATGPQGTSGVVTQASFMDLVGNIAAKTGGFVFVGATTSLRGVLSSNKILVEASAALGVGTGSDPLLVEINVCYKRGGDAVTALWPSLDAYVPVKRQVVSVNKIFYGLWGDFVFGMCVYNGNPTALTGNGLVQGYALVLQ